MLPNWKGSLKRKLSLKTRHDGWAVKEARLQNVLGRDFWNTSVCVGSNLTPVSKRFRPDEAEFSADKIPHTKIRVGLNGNPFLQIFWHEWRKLCKRLDLSIQKFINWNRATYKKKGRRILGRMAEKSNAPESRISSFETSTTRVSVRVRTTLMSKKVLKKDEAAFSADNFRHTGTSIQDDSP